MLLYQTSHEFPSHWTFKRSRSKVRLAYLEGWGQQELREVLDCASAQVSEAQARVQFKGPAVVHVGIYGRPSGTGADLSAQPAMKAKLPLSHVHYGLYTRATRSRSFEYVNSSLQLCTDEQKQLGEKTAYSNPIFGWVWQWAVMRRTQWDRRRVSGSVIRQTIPFFFLKRTEYILAVIRNFWSPCGCCCL